MLTLQVHFPAAWAEALSFWTIPHWMSQGDTFVCRHSDDDPSKASSESTEVLVLRSSFKAMCLSLNLKKMVVKPSAHFESQLRVYWLTPENT